jgi:hypothetical protein
MEMAVSKIPYRPLGMRISIFGISVVMILLTASINTFAQDLLEKRISIRVTNQPLDETLQKIGDLGDFSFSYSPDMIDVKAKISIQATNQSVREILIEIFKDKVTFKERRKYIILQKNSDFEKPEKPENFNLNGYIIDTKTGRKLANASIYESVTLASAVSNRYGYYKIRLPTAPTAIRLEVRKEDYIGKTIAIPNRQDTYLQITLTPDTLKPISGKLAHQTRARVDSLHHKVEIPQFQVASAPAILADTVRPEVAMNRGPDRPAVEYDKFRNTYRKVQNRFVSAFASANQAIHTRNIEDTLHRPFQASILPFLGTNHQLSGNIVNDYSINLIAGYSLGVSKLEVGGIFNVVRGNVTGFQLAGTGNIVGKDVTGFQYANFFNLTLGNFTGFQGTNFINYTGKNFRGFQVSGVGNVVVGVLDGYQFSAGYNYAHTVRKGHQIGFVNYSDSSAHAPLGLFSFVQKNGYRRYEFSSDELNYFNTAFKTGVSRFYNIFSLGFNGFLSEKPLVSLGYGFGTAQKLGRGWMVNADATLSVVVLKNQKIEDINIGMLKIALGIEKKIGNQFALFAGPTLNLLGGDDNGFFRSSETKGIRPIWIGEKPTSSTKEYTWLGFQAGIRFCNKY